MLCSELLEAFVMRKARLLIILESMGCTNGPSGIDFYMFKLVWPAVDDVILI